MLEHTGCRRKASTIRPYCPSILDSSVLEHSVHSFLPSILDMVVLDFHPCFPSAGDKAAETCTLFGAIHLWLPWTVVMD